MYAQSTRLLQQCLNVIKSVLALLDCLTCSCNVLFNSSTANRTLLKSVCLHAHNALAAHTIIMHHYTAQSAHVQVHTVKATCCLLLLLTPATRIHTIHVAYTPDYCADKNIPAMRPSWPRQRPSSQRSPQTQDPARTLAALAHQH
jgi:hypothetical protein